MTKTLHGVTFSLPGKKTQVYIKSLNNLCVSRPAVSQPYNQGAMNLTGPPHPSYPQHYGPPASMQQVTNQMTGMQITSGPPTPAGPGYGKL